MAGARQRGGREAEYRKLVAKQARSGLSVREFAEREGLVVQTFYWWRSELRRRERERARAGQKDESEFVRVSLSPSPATSGEVFELQLPDGLVVRVPPRFDRDDLVRLLGAVRPSC